MKVSIQHTGDSVFRAGNDKGAVINLGPATDSVVSPMEAVLMAIGGCTGADLISTLEKMRQPLESLEIQVEGERRDEHPRYFHTVIIRYILQGELERDKVERAVQLSLEKYCSVSNLVEPKAKLLPEIVIRRGGAQN